MLVTGPTEALLKIDEPDFEVQPNVEGSTPIEYFCFLNLGGKLVVCNTDDMVLYELPVVGCGLLAEARSSEARVSLLRVEPSLDPQYRTHWSDPTVLRGVYISSANHCVGCGVRDTEEGCVAADGYDGALEIAQRQATTD